MVEFVHIYIRAAVSHVHEYREYRSDEPRRRGLATVIAALVLTALVAAASGIAVTLFAAAQLQGRVADLAVNGTPLTIWRVDRFRGDLAQWNRSIVQRKETVELVRGKVALIDRDATWLEADIQAHEKRSISDIERTLIRISNSVPPSNNAMTFAAAVVAFEAAVLKITTTSAVASSTQTPAPLPPDIARIRDSLAKLESKREKLDDLKSQGLGHRAELSTAEGALKSSLAEVARLFGTTSNDLAPEFVERVVNVTAELDALTKVWSQSVYTVALWTNDMLVLLLVIAMGILGSSLYLLSTLQQVALSFWDSLLRLALGAVTAIVLFIVVKAGIPIIADTAKVGGGAPINPYFISVLGIISGLMSDRALASVRSVGTNLLRTDGSLASDERYARGIVSQEMEKVGRSYDQLAKYLGNTADEAKELLAGSKKVPFEAQRIVSAYLELPVRDLFTDLPAEK